MQFFDLEFAIFAALMLTCTLYALVLESLHDLYVPDWIFVTVVIGEGFIIGSLALMEHFDIPLTALRVVAANLAGGGPIVAWQIYQIIRRKQERHSGATPRREAADRSDRSA